MSGGPVVKKMKIAYLVKPDACYNGNGDGTRKQAEIWCNELRRQGHQVDMISPWGDYQWKTYDIVHFFGFGLWNYDMIRWGSGMNPNVVFSPVIDSNTPLWKYRLFSHIGCGRLRLFSQNYAVRCYRDDVKLFLARTQYEAGYIRQYGMAEDKIRLVPLSFTADRYDARVAKEPFCLFTGTMTQERKNVPRLIAAAKKFGFRLVLVGSLGNAESESRLRALIGDAPNIEVKGFVSDDELYALYNRAKVFALPSLNEGVGLVALEAAVHGCNIVITRLGGPKEYYREGSVWLVDPYDVDDIGAAVVHALQADNLQPGLRDEVRENYSVEHCVKILLEQYAAVAGAGDAR